MLVQYNLVNTWSCFISRVFWIEETDYKCNKGRIRWLGLPVGRNVHIYRDARWTYHYAGEWSKAVLALTQSNTPNGKQPELWQLAHQFLLLPVKTAVCSLWILHDYFCPSWRQYFLIAARKKMKTYLKMGHSGKFCNLVSVKNFNFQNPFVVPIVLVFFHEIFTGVGDPFALWLAIIAMIDGICPIAVV